MRLIVKLKIYFDEYLIKLNGISVILLLIFGVFLVSSATAVESQRIYSDSFYMIANHGLGIFCLLYTSPSPRDGTSSRMPSSA